MANFVEREREDLIDVDCVLRGRNHVSLMEVWHEALWQSQKDYRASVVPYLSKLLERLGWRHAKKGEVDETTSKRYYGKKGGTLYVRKPPAPEWISADSISIFDIRNHVKSVGGRVHVGRLIEKTYGLDLKTYCYEISEIRRFVESALRSSGWEQTGQSPYKGKLFNTYSRMRRA